MFRVIYLFPFSLFLSLVLSIPLNKDVQRTIDASKSIVRITSEIKTENLSKGDEYTIIIPQDLSENLAFVSVYSKNKDLKLSAPKT